MKYLFTRLGTQALLNFLSAPTLFAFDYDGTLAPIVSDPAHAFMDRSLKQKFQELAFTCPTAVISGRSVSDLRTFFPATHWMSLQLVGNHGAEGLPCVRNRKSALEICERWSSTLHLASLPLGTWIEDKRLSLSLHYRNCQDSVSARKLIKRAAESLKPRPRIVPGTCLLNLVPRRSPHKGQALVRLMKTWRCSRAIFVGDDCTDEDVFSLQNKHILGVRVGRNKESMAEYFIRDQSEVSQLLALALKQNRFILSKDAK